MTVYSSMSFVFLSCSGDHRDLHVLTHSFPTRRSSDLQVVEHDHDIGSFAGFGVGSHHTVPSRSSRIAAPWRKTRARMNRTRASRSEEHTSELKSLMRISYAVFCLKKKTKEE